MKKKLLGACPVCGNRLNVSELTCGECNTKISGDFQLSKFDYLSPEEQNFALVFLKNAGNIKQIEKELDISYPTVKKLLDSVISNLGFEQVSINEDKSLTKEEILAKLKANEISFDQAEKMLEELGE